jgi:2-polyprenyl-3-methyl-5-hydroxy-6-metoxy-1,4-benzoquinol methylase
MVDDKKLRAFVGRMIDDLGGASSIALVRLGDSLGLYKALHAGGPMTSTELAAKVGVHERYLREWLSHQAASGYVAYDPSAATFSLPEEQALVLAVDDSPVNMLGGFDVMAAMVEIQPKVEAAFKTGGGVAWGDHGSCLFCASARFLRTGYRNNLVSKWLPALDGVVDKLRRGAKVADVGCGHGWSTVMMAQAFPQSQFVGFDFHPGSIAEAGRHAQSHGVEGNTRFSVATAKQIPERDFDLVTCFDCLHDMGDPVGAAACIRSVLKSDGTWMVVEPMAGDRLEDNLNPIGRVSYAASTLVCVPTSLAQEVGAALGGQAGEAKLREVIGSAGFRSIRRAAGTAFNMVLEARP